VIVTGARGLGKGISRAFARRGASVLMCDVNGPGATASAHEIFAESGREVVAIDRGQTAAAPMI